MAVKSLQHFCLAVPDPALGGRFYEDFGLEAEDRGDRLALRCAGRDQDQIVLVEGARRQMHHISLGTDTAGLETLKKALEANGTELLDPPALAPGEGLWFRDPEGVLINLSVAESAPWADAPEWRINKTRGMSSFAAHVDFRPVTPSSSRAASVIYPRSRRVLRPKSNSIPVC